MARYSKKRFNRAGGVHQRRRQKHHSKFKQESPPPAQTASDHDSSHAAHIWDPKQYCWSTRQNNNKITISKC